MSVLGLENSQESECTCVASAVLGLEEAGVENDIRSFSLPFAIAIPSLVDQSNTNSKSLYYTNYQVS